MSASHRSSCRGVCPSASVQTIAANTCWWDRSSSWICSATLLAQPKRRILSSIAIGTTPNFRCSTLVGVWCLFGSPSQLLLVIARRRLASLFWPLSSGKSSFSVKLPFCPAQTHKPDSSASCMVTLETLHLNLKFTCGFQNTQRVPRVPGCRNSWFPSKDMCQVHRQTRHPTFVFESPASA